MSTKVIAIHFDGETITITERRTLSYTPLKVVPSWLPDFTVVYPTWEGYGFGRKTDGSWWNIDLKERKVTKPIDNIKSFMKTIVKGKAFPPEVGLPSAPVVLSKGATA